ncbi:hypothetical protein HDF19_06715 [Mucilaginibacter sp. E4BP6]|uniref:hypothetical protein n=1 Tax=Mucilaginibacter sp. E4BP6 TaxID=2723089 RepID=UPI0015CCFC25|nr:hypothetical protein [Mucilaginibacter sp. E4BP6]NYE68421.1 hypothetical protein [Mucilaginibacter sp. E4BP6]
MVISAIRQADSLYIDVHAEQSYTGTFLADKGDVNTNINLGIFGYELTRETLININSYVKSIGEKLNVVLDFSNIKDIQSNQQKLIVELKNNSKKLVFININEEVVKNSNVDIYTHNKKIGQVYPTFYLTDNKEDIEIKNAEFLFDEEFIKRLKNIVIDLEPGKAYRHNSPIYLPKFIDIKGLMVADIGFFMYVIYKLAKRVSAKPEWNNLTQQPILFCQNLNGAFIASVLSSFLDWDILSMDHIGPVNKVYSNIGSKIKSDALYVVVSDVVCLGTEIRICQNIINYSGGKYIGNVSIVRVDTLVPEDQAKDMVSVFNLSKNNNPIDYKILTALDL